MNTDSPTSGVVSTTGHRQCEGDTDQIPDAEALTQDLQMWNAHDFTRTGR